MKIGFLVIRMLFALMFFWEIFSSFLAHNSIDVIAFVLALFQLLVGILFLVNRQLILAFSLGAFCMWVAIATRHAPLFDIMNTVIHAILMFIFSGLAIHRFWRYLANLK
jgi:hypothetical protein